MAFALIALGVVLLMINLLPQIQFFARYLPLIRTSLWPIALIILGVVVFTRG